MENNRVLAITANMGYGHLRAIYPFNNEITNKIHVAGEEDWFTKTEKRKWNMYLKFYSFLSRMYHAPLIGKLFLFILDSLLFIPPRSNTRELYHPTWQVNSMHRQIKNGLLRSIRKRIEYDQQIILTSFYAVALAAELDTSNPVYCILCDTDISRAWVAKNPFKSRIMYFSPSGYVTRRLKQYGVSPKRIFETGFPFHKSLIGDNDECAQANYERRLVKFEQIKQGIDGNQKNNVTLNIMMPIGGAGAQYAYAKKIIRNLRNDSVLDIKFTLVLGINKELYRKSLQWINKLKPSANIELSVEYHQTWEEYFTHFNQLVAQCDILLTKPSELSFYAQLGIPLLITKPIGVQEWRNRDWLIGKDVVIEIDKPEEIASIVHDNMVNNGFTELAENGFAIGRRDGIYKIIDILKKH